MKQRLSIFLVLLLSYAQVHAAEQTPLELKKVSIDEHLGKTLSLELDFIDEHNKQVSLGDYFADGLPVLISLVYYKCPNLCTLVLNGKSSAINNLPWDLGAKYKAISISINPAENAQLALQKKQAYLKKLRRSGAEKNWSFLTGTEENIQKLADELGFRYYFDEKQGEFAHTSVVFVITPEGKISRYLYGISYEPRDLKLALLEASAGKIGNVIDKLLLYCYHYDPQGRKYALAATNAMKVAGGITLIGLGGLIYQLTRKQKRKAC